jgi:hypothetical protein
LGWPVVGIGCLLLVVLGVFDRILLRDELPLFRDAGHFYYPLYSKVQSEWEAGRLPLWDPGENAGMPLLGNPTAAVLYPVKALYWSRLWSYHWGTRAYTLFHILLAVAAMYALARSVGISRSGSGLAALGYGFGGPILFQYCNIIFLVGAAWAPLGFRAAHRWLALGKRSGLAELAVVLAMQTLGGDPQTAYMVGLCAAGYAAVLAVAPPAVAFRVSGRVLAWTAAGVVAWVGLVLAAAYFFPDWLQYVPSNKPRPEPHVLVFHDPLRNTPRTIKIFSLLNGLGVLLAVVFWLLVIRWLWRRSVPTLRRHLISGLAGLLVAGAAGGAITGAQLLPVLEFTGLSLRAAEEAPHDAFAFSIPPHRAVELVWPLFYGTSMPVNQSWINVLPPRSPPKPWVASLYLGGLTFLFALVGFGFRDGPPWRAWVSVVVVIAALGALGEYAGPLWWARFQPDVAQSIGYHDSAESSGFRFDRMLLDGDGSPYWLLSRLLPGFQSFRFPAKLWTIGCLGLAVLAGSGWDRLRTGRWRPALLWACFLAALTLVVLFLAWWYQVALQEWGRTRVLRAIDIFGPLDVAAAHAATMQSLLHALIVLVCAVFLVVLGRRSPRLAGALALLVTSFDLAIAQRPIVRCVPSSVYDDPPSVLKLIAKAEADDPSPGPYRVYRTDIWHPAAWVEQSDLDRDFQLVRWEYDTIQPKYGLLHGVEYPLTQGTTELYDLHFFFSPFERTITDPDLVRRLGIREGERVVYYPRRGFDLWNTRYFVLPIVPGGWKDPMRGHAAFLPQAIVLGPDPQRLRDPDFALEWAKEKDWQILRNLAAFPRAWVVHDVRVWKPVHGLRRQDREEKIASILYPNDAFWSDSQYQVMDMRKMAYVETEDADWFDRQLDRQSPGKEETVTVVDYSPQHVVLKVILERPGLVVLADVDYPGWRLTIDDEPAEVLRTNRLMRGARVLAGTHRLVYTYEPRSLAVGAKVSAAGLTALAALIVWGLFARRARAGDLRDEDPTWADPMEAIT